MEMVTNALNWFEIPVEVFDRAKAFYSRIFDFEMPQMPMGTKQMGFLLFEQGKGIGGAIVKGEGYVPSGHGPLIYLNGGSNLSNVLDRIEEARTTVSQWIEAQPGLTIARYRAFWSRVFSPELLATSLTGLRKAGLPEG